MVKLELKEFGEAARRMVQLSGAKKSRLMLRMRPSSGRKTFVLKATDGRTTLTTRVEHQGDLKIVEAIVNDFVGKCTAALATPAGKTTPFTASSAPLLSTGKQAEGGVSAEGGRQGGKPVNSANTGQPKQQQHGNSNKKRKGGRR